MRLHNRQVKADFWTDPDLLQLSRDMRMFYQGLWHVAEDSGCLEDSPFAIKLLLFPSPLDIDITVEVIAEWIEQFIALGKLIPYEVNGKRYLFLKNFHRHQSLRKPGACDIPLPSWVKWQAPTEKAGKSIPGKYIISKEFIPDERKQVGNINQDDINQIEEVDDDNIDSVPDQYQSGTNLVPDLYQDGTTPKGREEKVREDKLREDNNIYLQNQRFWALYDSLPDMPREKQLDVLVAEFFKTFPSQEQFKVGGKVKARESFQKAIASDRTNAQAILAEIHYFKQAYPDLPDPPPWELVRPLVEEGSSRTETYLSFDLFCRRKADENGGKVELEELETAAAGTRAPPDTS